MASDYVSPYTVDEELYLAPMSDKCIPSTILNPQMRKRSPKVMLSFSGGKDSTATYLALREAGWAVEDIYPFFLYWIPNLGFVERHLTYCEKAMFGGRHIERLPHPALYKLMNNLVYQPPERCHVIEEFRFPHIDYHDLYVSARLDWGLPRSTMYTMGVRASDSTTRWSMCKNYGPVTENEHKWSPIWDWRLGTVTKKIREAGLYLAEDYRVFGRSFDGIDIRFTLPMKREWPEDYAKVLEWFPMVEAEMRRYEYAQAD